MDFRARATWAGFSHHPEIVFLAGFFYVFCRVHSVFLKDVNPISIGFFVEFGGFAFLRAIDSCIKPFFGEFPNINKQFPSPFYRLFLEVVPERPVPKHFEESMVVCVKTNIFKVVVLSSGAYTFLSVGGSQKRSFFLTQKVWNKLVHSRVRKKQVGRRRH
ncbi:putative uncharacterized protein [Coraliomargarita sp. CAG:312]|nr:putative uncharacterized protein [Coraliomargarita sp. CAG:312]